MNEIVFVGDCHLGYRHRFKQQRLLDYASAFRDALEKIKSIDPAVVVFCGDLFHHPKPDPTSMRVVLQDLMELAAGRQIIMLIGNHEIEGHLGTTYTPLFSDLHENIHVLSTENPHVTVEVAGKKIGFHGFQYLRNPLVAEDTLFEVTKEVSASGNDYNILCMHQAIERYINPFEISIKNLRANASAYDLVMLGHVHKHQTIKELMDLTPTYYVGSTERISFNEWVNETGFMVYRNFDFSKPEYVAVESASMKQVKENLGEASIDEVNSRVKKLIEENRGVKLLQVNLEVELASDYIDFRRDWTAEYPGFTVLEVNLNPVVSEDEFHLEKIELDEEVLREYFIKSGLKDVGLQDLCIKLFNKYSK